MSDQFEGYQAKNTMREILRDNSMLVKTVGRFGIAFGFGDETVYEVCRKNNVDTETFITVCNLLSGYKYQTQNINLSCLVDYLKRTHSYFLEMTLPKIRSEIIAAINHSGLDEVAILMMKFYDEYVMEVQAHMDHENNKIFDYIEGLVNNKLKDDFKISDYSEAHDSVVEKLKDLKDIFIYHLKQEDNQKLSSTLFDIVMCEKDLTAHFEIESNLLIPAAEKLELELLNEINQNVKTQDVEKEPHETLSDREKEIIILVAKGFSNKEIGEKLFISTHTVATHRRNINAKLGIHSGAALAIFAVINGLIKIEEISERKNDVL